MLFAKFSVYNITFDSKPQHDELVPVIIPVFQMRNLRLREFYNLPKACIYQVVEPEPEPECAYSKGQLFPVPGPA